MVPPNWLTELYAAFRAHPSGISKDTRTLQAGQLYLALEGERFDGHAYAAQAIEKGAALAIVHKVVKGVTRQNLLHVPNTLEALQALASHHRQQFNGPVIGLTGSNGKTTSKAMLAAALSQRYHLLATPGNYNNHIGLPLTLLELKLEHELVLLEMGDNQPGDIAELCAIAQPTHGLITNLGMDHLEGYGSMEANRATKLELFEYLKQKGGLGFVNLADEALASYPAPENWPRYGAPPYPTAELQGQTVGELAFELEAHPWARQGFSAPVYGRYNLLNLLLAAVVSEHFGLKAEAFQVGISRVQLAKNRSEVQVRGALTLILDAYNANPSSVQLALEDLALQPGPKMAILGDMLELGTASQTEHEKLGYMLNKMPEVVPVFIGPEMRAAHAVCTHAGKRYFTETAIAETLIRDWWPEAGFVLLKGSRGMALEQLLQAIGTDGRPLL